jgi:hypothetical protein
MSLLRSQSIKHTALARWPDVCDEVKNGDPRARSLIEGAEVSESTIYYTPLRHTVFAIAKSKDLHIIGRLISCA